MQFKTNRVQILFSIYLVNQAAFYVFAPLYALFARSLNASLMTIGLTWSAYSLVAAISIFGFSKIPAGRPQGNYFKLSLVVYLIGDLLLLAVNSYSFLFIVLMINAIGTGLYFTSYQKLVSSSHSIHAADKGWTLINSYTMLAAAIGSAIGGFTLAVGGFHALFIAMVIVEGLATAAGIFLINSPVKSTLEE